MEESLKELLEKYLDGNCNGEELNKVKKLFDKGLIQNELHEIMQIRESMHDFQADDFTITERVQQMNSKVQRKIAELEENRTNQVEISRSNFQFQKLLIAASIIGIVLLSTIIGYKILYRSHLNDITHNLITQINNKSYPVPINLPDSSIIYLGSGSKIQYHIDYGKKIREINLTGKAFFEVTPNKKCPFIVHAAGVKTTVLGTSFLIDSKLRSQTEVSVATGKVAVNIVNKSIEKNLLILTPGRKMTINSKSDQFELTNIDVEKIRSWINGDIEFNSTPLSFVCDELALRYNCNIRFKDSTIRDYKISGLISKDQKLDSIIKMLSIIGDFKYHLSNDNKTLQIFK